MNSDCVETVVNWSQSNFYKTVQIFLKFINFYYCFITHYFKITVLLTKLLKRSVKRKKTESFIFFQNAETVFVHFQEAFCLTFILRHFNSQLSIQFETDASDFILVRILLQQFWNQNDDETIWHSVIY